METYNLDNLSADALVRERQLIPHMIPISHSTLWRQVKCGKFPKPVRVGERVTAWRVGDVRRYLAECGAEGLV